MVTLASSPFTMVRSKPKADWAVWTPGTNPDEKAAYAISAERTSRIVTVCGVLKGSVDPKDAVY